MKEKIYIYSKVINYTFIKKILFEYEVINLTDNHIIDPNFKNNNIIFVLEESIKQINKSFFSNNNVLVFFSGKHKPFKQEEYNQIKLFNGPIKIKKFIDNIKTSFFARSIVFEDIKILEHKIKNLNTNLSCILTPLEKIILIEFIEKKIITRETFLTKIFNIKKNIETKTIESHLTRIRRKLLKIESKIKISSKEDVFYIDN